MFAYLQVWGILQMQGRENEVWQEKNALSVEKEMLFKSHDKR